VRGLISIYTMFSRSFDVLEVSIFCFSNLHDCSRNFFRNCQHPLLPQTRDDGELNGKLNKLYVEHWIREFCRMSELGPWNNIILCNESDLGYGMILSFSSMCNEYHLTTPDHETNLSSIDEQHNDPNFAGFMLIG